MVGFNRWLPAPPNMIPESIKYVYRIMVDFYDKLEEELENEGRSGCGFHLKKSVKTARINQPSISFCFIYIVLNVIFHNFGLNVKFIPDFLVYIQI